MFYSQFILAKKGPLGTIWIAAHLERKLRKNQVADTDIGVSVDSILFPEMPIALRLSSHLLLGVVRIYSRKVNYLFDDCSEALLKVKQAFRSTAVDLPPEESTAPYHSITLPETFDLDDFELPESDILQGNYVDHHISSRDQITLQDTMEGVVYSTSKFGLDERFGDGDTSGLDLDEELLAEKAATAGHAGDNTLNSDVDPQASVQARTPLKHDENQDAPTVSEAILANGGVNQMDDFDGDNEPVEYAHAPCTPGLWEEPNLSNIQETSAYDDHQETENHNVTESAVDKKLENAPGKMTKYIPHEQEGNQFEPQDISAPTILATEHMSVNDLDSTHFRDPFAADQVRPVSLKSEVLETITATTATTDGPEGVEGVLNENAMHKEPGVQSVDENHEKCVELQGNLENTGHFTTQMEPNSETLCKDNLDNPHKEALREHEESKISPLSESMPCFDSLVLRPCATRLYHSDTFDESHADPVQITDVASLQSIREDPPNASGDSVLVQGEGSRTTNALVQGEGLHTTNALESNLQEIHVTEPEARPHDEVQVACNLSHVTEPEARPHDEVQAACNLSHVTEPEARPHEVQVACNLSHVTEPEARPHEEVQVACNISNEQAYNVIQGENIISYTSDFPAAEKLLSVPERLSDVANDLIPETTPTQEDIGRTDGGYYRSDMLTGKKRSFIESSLMTQSFNLVESSGLFNTKVTAESVPDDNDLLSSILVGRSSVLKVKPTPPPVMPSKRRRQSAPRTGVSKRKVVMDDSMVLHGDTIRQQLTSTEDIRRSRKKAPCTRPEISMIQKQFWEDELFDEVIFTGLSIKLAYLHNHSYDLSKIRVSQIEASSEGAPNQKFISQNEENGTHLEVGNKELDAPLEPNALKENGPEANFYPLADKDVQEAEPLEMPKVPDNQPCENNAMNSYYYGSQEQIHATNKATEPISSEHELFSQRTAMEIDRETFSAVDVGTSVVPIEVESLTTDVVPHDTSLQMDAPGFQLDQKTDLLSAEVDSSMDITSSKSFETSVAEIKVDLASAGEISETKHELVVVGAEDNTCIETLTGHTDCLESGQVANAPSTFSLDTDGLRPDIVTLDHDMEEIGKNEEEFINEDNAKNLISNGVFGEEPAYNADVDLGSKDVLLDDKEIQGYQDAYPAATTAIEDIFDDNKIEGDELEYSAVNDTDFLNFDNDDDDDDDDDDEAAAADDYLPNTEAKRFIDNSGWSSRTKAVTKYLQIMFDKEGERGRMALRMNNLLAGKTRKEASRMFFETLVLKTKDYIHVEQTDPFENIDILPRSKLLKSDF